MVVPVEAASDKAEIEARTLRPKILRLRESFLQPLPERRPAREQPGPRAGERSRPGRRRGLPAVAEARPLGAEVSRFQGGTSRRGRGSAGSWRRSSSGYRDGRSEAAAQQSSQLSPYLQFGQISPVEMALAAVALPPRAIRTGRRSSRS